MDIIDSTLKLFFVMGLCALTYGMFWGAGFRKPQWLFIAFWIWLFYFAF